MPNIGMMFTTPRLLLEQIKRVDGSGSGLDADFLDGLDSTQFLRNDTNELELPLPCNKGTSGKYIIKTLGTTASSTKPALILFCKKSTSENQEKQGFIGHVILSAGGTNIPHESYIARVICTAANLKQHLYLDVNSYWIYMIEAQYNGETWYGVYIFSIYPCVVTIAGLLFSEPIFIPDASGIDLTHVSCDELYVNHGKIWHSENDGHNSGLNADMVDGKHFSDLQNYFASQDLSDVSDSTILNKLKNVDGSESGLDADMLDGKHYSDIENTFIKIDGSNIDGSVIPNLNAEKVDGYNLIIYDAGTYDLSIASGSYDDVIVAIGGLGISGSNYKAHFVCFKDSQTYSNMVSIVSEYISDGSKIYIRFINHSAESISFTTHPILGIFYS